MIEVSRLLISLTLLITFWNYFLFNFNGLTGFSMASTGFCGGNVGNSFY